MRIALVERSSAYRHVPQGGEVPQLPLIHPEAGRQASHLARCEGRAEDTDAAAVPAPQFLQAPLGPLQERGQRLARDEGRLGAHVRTAATNLGQLLCQVLLQLRPHRLAVHGVQTAEADPSLAERWREDAAEGARGVGAVEAEVKIGISAGRQAHQVVLVRHLHEFASIKSQGAPISGLRGILGSLELGHGAQAADQVELQRLPGLVDGIHTRPSGVAVAQGSLATLSLEVVLGHGQLDQASMLQVPGRIADNLDGAPTLSLQLVVEDGLHATRGPRDAAEANLGRGARDRTRTQAFLRGHPWPHLEALREFRRADLRARGLGVKLRLEPDDDAALGHQLEAVQGEAVAGGDPDREETVVSHRLHRALSQQALFSALQQDAHQAADESGDGASLRRGLYELLVVFVLGRTVSRGNRGGDRIADTQGGSAAGVRGGLHRHNVPSG
mmetsp:Transcript_7351/g.26818  ORF Transcript_7351/g.26818 Transcript_7351/m.26818 type:complete len:444 (+) Transcript_7351:2422-3753(+)